MKRKALLIGLAALAAAAAGFLLRAGKKRPQPAPPAAENAARPLPEVPIRDHATIDFSSGQPVVKTTAEEKAIIDKAVKEMQEAAKDVTFEPIPPSGRPPEQKAPAQPVNEQPGN